MTFYQALAVGVIVRAFQDAEAGDQAARWWLEDNTPDLRFWCDRLGIPPAAIRRALADPAWPARLAAERALLAAERVHVHVGGEHRRAPTDTQALRESP